MYPISLAIAISTSELWEAVSSCIQTLPVRVVMEQAGVEDPATFIERIEQCVPDAILLDVSTEFEDLPEFIRQIKACPSHPEVIAVSNSSTPDEILRAIRAGAREFIYPPCVPSLPEALEKLAGERQKTAETVRPGGTNIGVVSAKGGLGATTLTCHAATEIQRRTGQDTLIIDMDLSAGLVRSFIKTSSRYSILDACSNVHRLDKSFWRALVTNGNTGLEVLGAPIESEVKEIPSAAQLRHVLRFVRTQYEWILVDLGRGRSPMLSGALDELDELLVVTTMEVPALLQVKQLLQYLRERRFGQNRIKLVLNRVVRRPELSIPDLEKLLGMSVFAIIGNDYKSLYEASSEGRLLMPDTQLCKQIGNMMARLAGLEQIPTPKKFFSSFF
ncbi:MAG: response regulator [Bryobacteraceae bacterium]|nr:response regulator [Bryobacteraceae bacterium]